MEEGYRLLPSFLTGDELVELQALTEPLRPRAGLRNLFRQLPAVSALARSSLVIDVVGEDAFPVRGILFDKTAESNWKVPWHQDLSIAVAQRREVAGYGPWSEKDGVVHVQPPVALLERMVTLRIHLDDCGIENGPLRVLPGTHRLGKVDCAQVARAGEVVCCLPAGGALLMRPLLVHASSPSTGLGRRRVVHLEFARDELPGELEWEVSSESRRPR